MARVGISITKSTPFRNSVQEFSNVYYYDGLASQPSVAQADALIDEAVAREKTWHSTAVTFVRGRCWSQVGDKTQNEMISQKNLSGTGSQATVSTMDKERAYLFRLRAGVDVRGNPVYLRKWYHACGNFDAAVGVPNTILDNSSGWTQANRDALVNKMNSIGSIGSGVTAGVLVAKNGRSTTAGFTWQSHPYLEHHQMGDMWRAQ